MKLTLNEVEEEEDRITGWSWITMGNVGTVIDLHRPYRQGK